VTTSTITVFTADEVAQILRCNRETVYRWARKGQIKSARQPGQRAYRFTQAHIDAFLSGETATEEKPKTAKPSRNPKYAGK
jgi:excisionase family DNA binding protein